LPDQCLQEPVWIPFASRKPVVGKSNTRANKNIVLKTHAIPKVDAALYGYAIADDDVVFDKNMIAEIAILSDFCASENMGECPNARCASDVRA